MKKTGEKKQVGIIIDTVKNRDGKKFGKDYEIVKCPNCMAIEERRRSCSYCQKDGYVRKAK